MRKLFILTAICCLALACTPQGAEEIVVTRDQLGAQWPLQVNSARLSCSDEGVVLRLGQKRYALDTVALAQGREQSDRAEASTTTAKHLTSG